MSPAQSFILFSFHSFISDTRHFLPRRLTDFRPLISETRRLNQDNIYFSIQRFAVIPLSTNSGLIGWVPHCDTLHLLIREYREKKKVLLNIEHRIMQRVCLIGSSDIEKIKEMYIAKCWRRPSWTPQPIGDVLRFELANQHFLPVGF